MRGAFPGRKRIVRFPICALTVALLTLGLFVPAAFADRRSVGEQMNDCFKDADRTRDACVRDSCAGVCTLEAWQRCDRLAYSRWNACVNVVTLSNNVTTPPRRPTFRPLPANDPGLATSPPKNTPKVPSAGILDDAPTGSPQGPSGVGTPVSAPARSPAPTPVFR
jgi:hypothetical protein